MHTTHALIVITSLLAARTIAGTVNFEEAKPREAPAGWMATQTGKGTAHWVVENDDSAPSPPNVLKQSGIAAFPICLKEGTRLTNGFVEVKFKPVSGKEDQAGGVIWRAQDANNYYVARANALEDNICIYHTIQGKRTEMKRTKMKVASNEWHTLQVEFSGDQFTVRMDGKPALEWGDSTFADAGMVGLWTKADSVTLFDDFSYGSQ